MKIKLITAFSFISIYFIYVAKSYAINPCPKNDDNFSNICGFNSDTISTFINNGIIILFIVAIVASLFFLIFGGIRWITSGGEKANIEAARNMIVAAAVGLAVTFLSFFILNFILQLFGLNPVGSLTIPELF